MELDCTFFIRSNFKQTAPHYAEGNPPILPELESCKTLAVKKGGLSIQHRRRHTVVMPLNAPKEYNSINRHVNFRKISAKAMGCMSRAAWSREKRLLRFGKSSILIFRCLKRDAQAATVICVLNMPRVLYISMNVTKLLICNMQNNTSPGT